MRGRLSHRTRRMKHEQRDQVDEEHRHSEQGAQRTTFRSGPRKALPGDGIQPILENPHHAAQQKSALTVV